MDQIFSLKAKSVPNVVDNPWTYLNYSFPRTPSSDKVMASGPEYMRQSVVDWDYPKVTMLLLEL
jgi:hypothetical protein